MAGRRGAVLLLVLAGVALGGDSPRAGIQRDAKFQKGVDAAIDRGVGWLREAQKPDGSYTDFPTFDGATTALAYHTLRVCGVKRDDPAAVRAWDAAKRLYARENLRTYSAAIYLMAIASHGDPVAKATDDRDVHLSAEDAKWAREVAGCLAGAQDDEGCWSYMVATNAKPAGSGAGAAAGAKPHGEGSYDHSNTQYALLGLKSAARCGVPIDDGIWKRSLDHFLAAQEKSGPEVPRGTDAGARKPAAKGATRATPLVDHARGWQYDARPDPRGVYASMTATGVSSIVICRSELLGTRAMTSKLDADSERAVWDGLAWLGTNWKPTKLDLPAGADLPAKFRDLVGSGADLYECYGVERAGILAGVDWMGPLDWYGAGADVLVEGQGKDGSWNWLGGGLVVGDEAASKAANHVVDTCFGLLFLKRGTAPVRRGAVTQGGADDDINFAVASKLGDKDFEDFLDLVLARWRRATDDAVKTRLFDGATSVGPRIVEPLLVRMDSADVADRASAHALLRHATGLDLGFVADATVEVREAALVKWQSWWMKSKDRVVYDADSRRLVAR
jgi:hypothetical protein